MTDSHINQFKSSLDRVSFNFDLFSKEYDRAVRKLNKEEQKELNNWLFQKDAIRNEQLRVFRMTGIEF